MDTLNLKLALKDPSDCSAFELDEILEAQLTVVQSLRLQEEEFLANSKKQTGKNSSRNRKNLKNIGNRI